MNRNKSCVKLYNGYYMPLMGLGTWLVCTNEQEAEKAIETAIDAGYRHIDTAYVYDNEHFLGKILKKLFEKGKVKRSDMFIVSKLPPHGMREENVEYFFEKSLSALQLDYLDLYLLHSPAALKKFEGTDEIKFVDNGVFPSDLEVDFVKTWKKVETLVDKKLVRSIGLSNFNSKQIQRVLDIARIKPANLQVECHVYLPQYELQEFCKNLNIAFTAYSPLGTPGKPEWVLEKYGVKLEDPKLIADPTVVEIAAKHKITPAQVLLRYLVQRDIIVIPKSANLKRIKENIEIFDFQLTDEDMAQLKTLGRGYRFFPHDTLPGKSLKMDSSIPVVQLSSGYSMPLVGLGTWLNTTKEQIEQSVEAAIDAGYRLIDTAFIYENEHHLGKTLKRLLDNGKVQRSDLFIVSKLPSHGMREENVEYFFEKSRLALQLDYMDLYLIHSPIASKKFEGTDEVKFIDNGVFPADLEVDFVKTWKKMEILVEKKLVRSIGLSNFNSKQIQRVFNNARIKPANLQVECHIYLPQYELQEFCKNLNITITAHSPLGTPGKPEFILQTYGVKLEQPMLLLDPKVIEIAQRHKKTPAQVLLRHLVQRGIIVIPKSTHPGRIKENVEIFDFQLTHEDMAQLKTLARGYRFMALDVFPGIQQNPEFPFSEPF